MSDSSPVSLAMNELLVWNEEASAFWNRHLNGNPDLLKLPCGIGGAATVQDLVRHIWGAELRWAERLSGIPETPWDSMPTGPLAAIFAIHEKAAPHYSRLLSDPHQDWEAPYTFHLASLPDGKMSLSRRKVLAHALLHGQRHWAQLATLVRAAGFPSGFHGDILFSSALN